MQDREYHRKRERQCREMADRSPQDDIKQRHIALAELHHKLSRDEESKLDAKSARAKTSAD